VADRNTYIALARKYARQRGIPEDIYLAQLNQESHFNPTARSYADARGIAQIVPKWHPDVNPNMKGNQLPGINPEWDIAYSTNLMASHFKKYGSWERALSAYNSGRPDAYKDPNFSGGQTYNYVKKILAGRSDFKAGTPSTFGDEYSQDDKPNVSSDAQHTSAKGLANWIMANNKAFSEGNPSTQALQPFLQAAEAQELQRQGLDGGEKADPGVNVDPSQVKGQPWEKVMGIIKYAQSLGLRVSENPYVDKVDPVHVKGSHHYQTYKGQNVGKAMDVSGDPKKLKALFAYLERNYQGLLNDMFYSPVGYSYDNGKRWGQTIKNHEDHLHASFY
jgi:hypothetical protein